MNMKKKTELWTVVGAAVMIAALLAVAAFAQGAAFRFFGPLSRIITPNGDGRNDLAIFCFDNPAGSGVSGNVFSLLGSAVGTMGPETANPTGSGCPAGTPGPLGSNGEYMTWDGRSNGTVVRSGVYIYRIRAEEKSYTGTLIVVR